VILWISLAVAQPLDLDHKELATQAHARQGPEVELGGGPTQSLREGRLLTTVVSNDLDYTQDAWVAVRAGNAGDFDGDGNLDLVSGQYATGGASSFTVAIQLGFGDLSFDEYYLVQGIYVQPQNTMHVGDVDGDGCADWVGGSDDDGDSGAIYLSTGNCDGSTNTPTELVNGCDVVSGDCYGGGSSWLYDWDGDGDLDLLATLTLDTGEYVVHSYENLGGGSFDTAVEVIASGWLISGSLAAPANL